MKTFQLQISHDVPVKFNRYTEVALEAAFAGGEILRKHFNKPIRIAYKGTINPVTNADRGSQETIRKILLSAFPEHTMMGEEDKKMAECSDYCWIVDPLDGTVNFIHNMPIFCVSVALLVKGEVVSGVIHAPLLHETFVAEKGRGAWLNGKKIKVSRINRLIRSLVITGFPYTVSSSALELAKNFASVLSHAEGVRRLGSAALDLAYVASGRCEAFWEQGLYPWDVAAGSLIVQEAGGKVTDFYNKSDYIFGRTILASNGKVHKAVRSLISNKK